MAIKLENDWIWDSWYVRDGDTWHGYFLKAPKSLINPDLRHSGVLADADTWKGVVIDGMLKDNGMVSFNKALTPEQADMIRIYVIDQANWDKSNGYK